MKLIDFKGTVSEFSDVFESGKTDANINTIINLLDLEVPEIAENEELKWRYNRDERFSLQRTFEVEALREYRLSSESDIRYERLKYINKYQDQYTLIVDYELDSSADKVSLKIETTHKKDLENVKKLTKVI